MKSAQNRRWPVLRAYDQQHLSRIALPVGGIGTGTVSLGGRGDLRDWEVMNRPAKGFRPPWTFFALTCRRGNAPAVTRVLEGMIDPSESEGMAGAPLPMAGMPRFRKCSFETTYPFGRVLLSDPGVPLRVDVEAFNPFVPADADASGIPVAIFRITLINPTSQPIRATVAGSLPNFVGTDREVGYDMPTGSKSNRNTFRRERPVQGVFMDSLVVDPKAEQWGSIALATTATTGVSYRTSWQRPCWGTELREFWDDLSADGRLDEPVTVPGDDKRPPVRGLDTPMASLAVAVRVPPRSERVITFLIAWHFPNRRTWTPTKATEQLEPPAKSCCADTGCGLAEDDLIVGNYYATRYRDAWDVAVRTAAELDKLEDRTLAFVRAFCGSDFPSVVKEAVLFNLSSLRTQTCFRIATGEFAGWEGCGPNAGCCHGSVLHVWNYEIALGYLFGSLSRSMRDVELLHANDARGLISTRINLPLARAQELQLAVADGQCGVILKLYRDWKLSGDDAWLRRLWPSARRAIEFFWIDGGWDADVDGVMEGCQHNTMDTEYFGPNPPLQTQYLVMLRATEELARHLGEEKLATKCRDLFERGSAWTDAHLFNGEFYEQEIRPPLDFARVAPGLRSTVRAAQMLTPDDPRNPPFQIGRACLIEQTIGQLLAHSVGLGDVLKPANQRAALRSVFRHNRRDTFHDFPNHLRAFVLNDETAWLMATWPKGRRERVPFPYFSEVMTGFEYVAACHMLYEGMSREALTIIRAIRDRYDGHKRSPFDEAECGHHYIRTLVNYAAVLALTGFRYSAVTGEMTFAAAKKPAPWFWSTGEAWGTFEQKGRRVALTIIEGRLKLHQLTVTNRGSIKIKSPPRAGETRRLVLTDTP